MSSSSSVGIDAILNDGDYNDCGESPVWNAAEKSLYWTDIPQKKIHRYADGEMRAWDMPEMTGCIALRSEGLIGACESGIFEIGLSNSAAATTRRVASVTHPSINMRFNDGRCDRQGRFLASTLLMGERKPIGSVMRYTAAGLEATGLDGLTTPNGMAFSPDGKTMYLADSAPTIRTIWAFDYDIDDGSAHNRRIFIDMHDHVGRPDGATVNADGCYWICSLDAGFILRFTPAGKLDRMIAMPMKNPTMCAFGGERFDTLFVTSLCRTPADRQTDPHAGCMLAFEPGVRGMSETRFGN